MQSEERADGCPFREMKCVMTKKVYDAFAAYGNIKYLRKRIYRDIGRKGQDG